MTEQFALTYAEKRRVQLRYAGFHLSYREVVLRPGEVLEFSAVNQMYCLIKADKGVRIISSSGQYYSRSTSLSEQKHEHTGQIKLQNNDALASQVTFAVFLWYGYVPRTPQAVSKMVSVAPVTASTALPTPVTVPPTASIAPK